MFALSSNDIVAIGGDGLAQNRNKVLYPKVYGSCHCNRSLSICLEEMAILAGKSNLCRIPSYSLVEALTEFLFSRVLRMQNGN